MQILDHLFGVAGKTVPVTGGGRGIGESIAKGFVMAGAKVYICSRKAETCAETARAACGFRHLHRATHRRRYCD